MKPQEERKCFTIQKVRAWGANIDEAMPRCLNNETFYLRLVMKALENDNYDRLSSAVAAGDKKAAFEAAHAIKGMMGNLGLTPLYELSSEMTELLRAGKDADYADYLAGILRQRETLLALCDD